MQYSEISSFLKEHSLQLQVTDSDQIVTMVLKQLTIRFGLVFMCSIYQTLASDNLETRVNSLEDAVRITLDKYEQFEKDHVNLRSEVDWSNQLIVEASPMNATSVGTTYIRWGRTECPSTAELVYHGYTGKSYFNQGGGIDYQCLHPDPEWPIGATDENQHHSYIYGVEYHDIAGLKDEAMNQDAPCALCNVEARTRQMMIPGRETCPEGGWVREYYGLLVAQQYDEGASNFVCLDKDFEFTMGGYDDDNGGTFYIVEAKCGALPCAPYVEGMELACVVCTK